MFELKEDERLIQISWWDCCLDGTGSAGVWFFAFLYELDSNQDAEDVVRAAVNSYYSGLPKDAEEYTRGYQPNWGDVMNDIPAEHWAAFGLRRLQVPMPASYFTVEHDEIVYRLERQ